MIKNIIFDVGNVLVTWDPYVPFEKFFKNRDEITAFFEEIDFKNMVRVTDLGVTYKTAIENAVKKFPRHEEALLAYDTGWASSVTGKVDGTLEMMVRLKKAGYGVYGLSNFSHEKFPICAKKYGFAEHFDGVVISGEVREVKPEEPIYKILLKKYNLKPEECVFLDDRRENLETAKRLGFKTILFTDAENAEKELRSLGVKF